MKYTSIFKEHNSFFLRHDAGVVKYQFRLNDDKGEFIDQDNNVVAQVYEVDMDKPYFVVAGMFIGEIIFKSIPYYRCVSQRGASLIKTNKYKPSNSQTVKNESKQ